MRVGRGIKGWGEDEAEGARARWVHRGIEGRKVEAVRNWDQPRIDELSIKTVFGDRRKGNA